MESIRDPCAVRPALPWDRPRGHCLVGLPAVELPVTSSRRRVDVHHDQDDREYRDRRASAATAAAHDLDDADNDRCLHLSVPGWAGNLHFAIEHRRRSDSVLRRRSTTY